MRAGIALGGPKIVFFAPQEATHCPDKQGPLPRAKFHVKGRNMGTHPQNCQNLEFCP